MRLRTFNRGGQNNVPANNPQNTGNDPGKAAKFWSFMKKNEYDRILISFLTAAFLYIIAFALIDIESFWVHHLIAFLVAGGIGLALKEAMRKSLELGNSIFLFLLIFYVLAMANGHDKWQWWGKDNVENANGALANKAAEVDIVTTVPKLYEPGTYTFDLSAGDTSELIQIPTGCRYGFSNSSPDAVFTVLYKGHAPVNSWDEGLWPTIPLMKIVQIGEKPVILKVYK